MKTRFHPLLYGTAICGSLQAPLFAASSALRPQGCSSDTPTKQVVYKDDFDNDLSQWVVEQMPGGTTAIIDGQLDIDDSGGCTVWFKRKLTGPILIKYEATMIKQSGKNDRVSDLNCFWMATDPENPDDLFANTKRGGNFKSYHPLRLYYVGYGANNNTTTRFRKYPGGGARPLLAANDLRDKRFMHTPNKRMEIQIISNGGTIQYLRNGETVFEFGDNEPLTEGWFGFRTVQNHMRINHFRVYQLSSRQCEQENAPDKN